MLRHLQSQCNYEDDHSKDDLECDGETPLQVVRAVKTSIIDPVSDERTNSDITTFDTDELSAVMGFAALGLIGRDS